MKRPLFYYSCGKPIKFPRTEGILVWDKDFEIVRIIHNKWCCDGWTGTHWSRMLKHLMTSEGIDDVLNTYFPDGNPPGPLQMALEEVSEFIGDRASQ